MALRQIRYAGEINQTLYAFPMNQGLAEWLTYRAVLTQSIAPNLGRYQNTVDDDIAYEWAIFAGAGQPADWSEAITSYDVRVQTILATLEALNNLDSTATQAAAAAALTAYDAVTRAEATADKDEVLAALSSAGSNDYNIAVTVTDGTDPVLAAFVRVIDNSTNGTVSSGSTDTSGNVTLTANAGSVTIVATKSGYSADLDIQTITSNTTSTLTLTANMLASVTVEQSAATGVLVDGQGNPLVTTLIEFRLIDLADDETDGILADDAAFTITTDASGNISGALIRGATYQCRVGRSMWREITVPDAASFSLPALLQ